MSDQPRSDAAKDAFSRVDAGPGAGILLPEDVAHATFALMARHTSSNRAAVYPLPVEHVVAIHSGQRITTEPAAVVHEQLTTLLQNAREPSWLMIDASLHQLSVLAIQQALAELVA